MMILISIFLFAFAALVMLVIRLFKPAFPFQWIITTLTLLATWILILVDKSKFSQSFTPQFWQPEDIFPNSPEIFVDSISWSFSLALIALALGAMLTDITQSNEINHSSHTWLKGIGILIVTSAGILAVCTANMLSLMMIWTLLDVIVTILLMKLALDEGDRQRSIVYLATQMSASGLIWLGVISTTSGVFVDFAAIPPQLGNFLLLAVAIRLGVFPPLDTMPESIHSQQLWATILRAAPATSSLMVLTRLAKVFEGIKELQSSNFLLLFLGFIALYASLSWLKSHHEPHGQPFWIGSLAAFCAASAVIGQAETSIAWGLILLLCSGALQLLYTRQRWLIPLMMLGAIPLTTLPFTPAAEGAGLISQVYYPVNFIFLTSQSIILAVYLRSVFHTESRASRPERWVWLIYPMGLAIPISTLYLISGIRVNESTPIWFSLVSTLIGILLASGLLIFDNKGKVINWKPLEILQKILSLDWLYAILRRLVSITRSLTSFISFALEGPAGFLWVLLLLALLASLLAQVGLGD